MKNRLLFILLSGICYNTFANTPQENTYSISDLEKDSKTTEKLLSDMLSIDRMDLVDRLLPMKSGRLFKIICKQLKTENVGNFP